MKVLGKFLGLSDPKILTETYKFWAPIYPAKACVDPAEIETYLSTAADRASGRVEDFFDNSIIAGLDREGLIHAIYRKHKK